MKGTQFYKVDLQIHTPASKCYEEKHTSANQIVQEAIAKGLDIIAITDHNDTAFIEAVRGAAKGKPLDVFPGIEITAVNGHILAIFDKNTPVEYLNDLLVKLNITFEMRGKREALGPDVEDTVSKVADAGGLAIAAHAYSSNGILKHPKGQYKLRVCKMHELAALEFTDQNDVERYSKGKVPQYPAKACLQGSDAHNLADIGKRFTYLKMDTVSLEGIRQALLDHEVKVRYSWNFKAPQHTRIKKLVVSQGFFAGEAFEFHPNLNCLVGGRGTGKSTVIELIRYCFNDLSQFDDIREDTYGKALKLVGAGGRIMVMYENESGEEAQVERIISEEHDEPPTIRTALGDETGLTSFPIFFSQGEIARIASSSSAQLGIIDRYIDVDTENREEERIILELNRNAAELVEISQKVSVLQYKLTHSETGKTATSGVIRKLEESLKQQVLTEFPKWESDQRIITTFKESLAHVRDNVESNLKAIDMDEVFSSEVSEDSPRYDLLRPLNTIKQAVLKKIETLQKSFPEMLRDEINKIEEIEKQWLLLFRAKKHEYDTALAKLTEKNITIAQQRLRTSKKRMDEIKKEEAELSRYQTKQESLRQERTILLEQLREVRMGRFNKRQQRAVELEGLLGGRIKVEVAYGNDRRDYEQLLQALLHGSYLFDRDIRRLATTVDPQSFVSAVVNRETDVLSRISGLTPEVCQRCIDYLKQKNEPELLGVEAVQIHDMPSIRFEVEPGVQKPLHELSVGQKGTVIMSLALIEGRAPIIIDQPEDSLDTVFIYEEIVKKLRTGKEMRQFIFATHNPNILVSADADLSFVLDASADKGTIKVSGGIDHLETNKLLMLHLEGGEEAFRLRAQKYRFEEKPCLS